MYAIVKTGGKQYIVQEGDKIKVEKLAAEEGSEVSLTEVVGLGGQDSGFKAGKPFVEGAKVTATVLAQAKGKKVMVGKFKAKKGYKRVRGHRQPYTLLEIKTIEA